MGYEIEFLPVGEGNGDAICIRYGNIYEGYYIHLIDGGYTDTGNTIIDHITNHYGQATYIDNIVLSHADADHATGLLQVLEHFEVGALWMNRPWLYAAEVIDAFHGNYTVTGLEMAIKEKYPIIAQLEALAVEKGTPIHEAFGGKQAGPFTILAPTRESYLSLIPQFDRTPTSYARPIKGTLGKLFEAAKALVRYQETWNIEALQENPDPTSASNESSVVQLGIIDGKKLLFTADAGPSALNEAADVAKYLGQLSPPAFVQVPHHGSRRNVTPSTLNGLLGSPLPEHSGHSRGIAFCSVGSGQKAYPRNRVSNAFLRRGYPVYKTTGDYIRISNEMPERNNLSPIDPVPFNNSYEE